jgi:hypothetical protein
LIPTKDRHNAPTGGSAVPPDFDARHAPSAGFEKRNGTRRLLRILMVIAIGKFRGGRIRRFDILDIHLPIRVDPRKSYPAQRTNPRFIGMAMPASRDG